MHLLREGNKRHSCEGCNLVPARPSSKEGWRKGRVMGSEGKWNGGSTGEKNVEHLG